MRHISRFDAGAWDLSSRCGFTITRRKIMRTTTTDAKLSAIRIIRAAWFDESLDAEARGDVSAAAEARRNVDACDVQIRRMEKQLVSGAGYPATIKSAFGMLRMRSQQN